MKYFFILLIGLSSSLFAQISNPNDWQLSVDHTQVLAVPDITPSSITETVRGLENDPLRIFHHILNHYDFQAYFGLYKGYERTFYDKAGNDADLCQLLAKMLTIAGYSPEYVEGWMTIPEERLSRWLKTQSDTDGYKYDFSVGAWDDLGASNAIQIALSSSNVYNKNDSSNYNLLSYDSTSQVGVYTFDRLVYRFCVKVTINGTEHILDPAFKEYDLITGSLSSSDLGSVMGYNQAGLFNALGGTTVTNGIQGLDEAALRNTLSGYATNLKSALLTTHRNKDIKDIFGGHSLVKQTFPSLPITPQFTFTQEGSSYTDFPYYRKHYYQFKYSNIDVLLSTAEINPKRLYMAFDNQRAELFLDEVKIAEEPSIGSSNDKYFICIDHPYRSGSPRDQEAESVSALNRDTACLTISKSFAPNFHDRWFNKIFEETKELNQQGVADNDLRMLSRNLELYGIAYSVEKAGYLDLIAKIDGNGQALLLHDSGVTFQNASFGMSWLAWNVSNYGYEYWNTTTQQSKNKKIIGAVSYYGSALEHGIIDQLQEDNGGISTVRGLSFANDDNQELYYLNYSQYQSLKPSLISNYGWTNAILNSADQLFLHDPASHILIHRDYNLSSPVAGHTWSGGVYWVLPSNADGGQFLLSGLTNGGSSLGPYIMNFLGNIVSGTVEIVGNVLGGVFGTGFGAIESVFGGNPTSVEPVDLATGAYLSEHSDLILASGSLPKGLSFTRYYNSHKNNSYHQLGNGWSHSLDVKADSYTYFPMLFGGRLPVDTVAQIVGGYVNSALAEMGQDDVKEVMASMMTAHWSTDEIVDNAVSIQTGHRSHIYARHADGTYTAPPGITDTLTLSGGNFSLSERHGNTYNFTDINGRQHLSTVVDQHGNTASFTYDSTHRLSSVSDCFSRSLTFNYNSTSGYLDSVSDSTTRSVDFTIDANGDQTAYDNADDQTFTFEYDSEHRITKWIDNQSRTIAQNVYDSIGQVKTQFSEGLANHEWTFLYTGFENIEQDPLGNQKHYFFDEQLNHTGFEDGEGNLSAKEFNVEQLATKVTDPTGNYTTTSYNSDLNPTTVSEYDSSDVLLRSSGMAYDSNKRLQTQTNARGFTTTFTYNAKHQILTTQRQGAVGNTQFSYNANGTLAWSEDQDDNRTTFGYDSYQNVNLITAPDSTSVSSIFNVRGDLTSVTDARGNTTTHQYNKRRLVTRSTNAQNNYTETSYDGMDKPLTVRDHRGNITTNTYNPLGKITSTDHPLLSGNTIYAYDRADRLVSITSPEGIVNTNIVDGAGRVTTSSDPIASITSVFDARGLVTSVTDALSQTTSNTFDALGRLETVTNALSEVVTYSYDANNNRIGVQNARLQSYSYTFDSLDRLTEVETPDGHTTTTTYTNLHQVDVVTKPSLETVNFNYDSMNRLDTIVDGVGTRTYSHDNNGNVTAVTQGAQSISYVLDSLNRVTSYTDESGNTIGYGYDADSNMTSLTYPGNLTVAYQYNALNRMTSVTDWNSRQTLYSYDEDGRVTSVTRPNGTVRSLSYDSAGRLTKVTEQDSNGYLIFRSDLGLDAVGKITSEFRIPKSNGMSITGWTASHNNDDEISTISSGTITHDIDGRMTEAPLSSTVQSALSFNTRDQLTALSGATYTYGIEGRRLTKTVGGTITTFVTNPLGNLATTLMETTGGITRYYIYGMGLVYHSEGSAGAPPASSEVTYHFNHIGNTVALTATDGFTITDRIEYSPYGEQTYREGTTETGFLYNGMLGVYTDAESGLIQMRARYYSPYLKRFLKRDPIGFEGGANHFAFAASNPLSFADPSGLGPVGGDGFFGAFESGFNAGRSIGNTVGSIISPIASFIPNHMDIVYPQGQSNNFSDHGGSLGIPGMGQDARTYADILQKPQLQYDRPGFQISELLYAGFQKLTFGLLDYKGYMASAMISDLGYDAPMNVNAHSQGTLIANTVMLTGGFSEGSNLTLNGPAANFFTSSAYAGMGGYNMSYNVAHADWIGLVNFPHINPIKNISAIGGLFRPSRHMTQYVF